MSGYSVQIHRKTPLHSEGADHEVTLINPHGAKRWFTATGLYQAKVIAGYWADFLGVDTIDLYYTPAKPVEYVQLTSIITDKVESHEKTGVHQDDQRTAPDPEC